MNNENSPVREDALKFSSFILNHVKNKDLCDQPTNEIIDDFMKIIHQNRTKVTNLYSKKKTIQKLYKRQFEDTHENVEYFMELATKLSTYRPNKILLDIANSVIEILQLSRHDLFLLTLSDSITANSDYKWVAFDFKLKDHFPTTATQLTPDILLKNSNDDYLIIEAKVTVDSDLIYFYNRYKSVVGDLSKVHVVNYNNQGVLHLGDYKEFNFQCILDDHRIPTIDKLIDVCRDLRRAYSSYPEFSYFSNFYSSVGGDDNFISNFKDKFNSLEANTEIKSVFGPYYNDLIDAVENFSLITNEVRTTAMLNSASDDAVMYCKESLGEFHDLFEHNKESGLYKQTVLAMGDLAEFQDIKASSSYDFTDKLKPSLYIPMNYGFEINTSRQNHYKNNLSQTFRRSTNDNYTNAVQMMLSVLSEDECLENLFNKHDETIVEVTTSNHADINIYQNNAFSFINDKSSSIKNGIIDFDARHNKGKRKTCLNYSKESKKLTKLKDSLSDVFSQRYNNQSYRNDLLDLNQSGSLINRLSPDHQNNFLDYLFVQHAALKALISINVISNHKFRLIQTKDPNLLIVALPNSNSLAGAPLKYLTISIEKNENLDKSIMLNKLLGIYNSHLIGRKTSIIISKVISLDMTRVKLLTTSFAKYCQLISYYRSITQNITFDVQMLALLSSNLVTISSLSITDTFKNIMMVCYSTFSNPEELIRDKLECRPQSMVHIYLLSRVFDAIGRSQIQRDEILKGIKSAKISNDSKEIIDTGFDISADLYMPLSGIKTTNPKEILHESYILFYLGNKGLHGSPQELLNLYHVPYQYQKEYETILKERGTFFQEFTNDPTIGCSYEAMALSAKLTYSQLLSISSDLRGTIIKNLDLEGSILTKPQFTSTKSMVREDVYNAKIIDNPDKINNLNDLERYIKSVEVDNPDQFIEDMNKTIAKINHRLMTKSLVLGDVYGEEKVIRGNYNKLPDLAVKTINDHKFIVFNSFKKQFCHPCSTEMKKQYSDKVFNNVIETIELNKFDTLRSIYESDYIDCHDPLIRIFYKDQRSFVDREIYTGNLTTRLCLYPLESLCMTINKRINEEAITIQGEKKQKRMLDQRIDLLRKRKMYNKNNEYKSEILSMSCDASKWSARDMMLKFLITIAYNPFLTPEEKYFYLYLLAKYYRKFIILTEDAFFNAVKFMNKDNERTVYEELTSNFSKNYQLITSNWLQGNFNGLSSLVHVGSALLSGKMLDVLNAHYGMHNHMNFMVHSDDSVYDFLLMKKNNLCYDSKYTGTFLYTLIQWSTRKHCITINRKKTYISNFYKEFLSTTIVGNELFYFYLADLLPISSDVTYDSPLDDLSAYSGYINNAFTHACPIDLIKTSIMLINHLTMSTYNLNLSSEKSPYKVFLKDKTEFSDLPIQIMPRYKIPIELAGTIPYFVGDALNIFMNIIERLSAYVDLNKNLKFEDLFNLDLMKQYLEKEKDISKLNYIKACLLTANEDILTQTPEDPYDLTDIDSARKNLIAVMPPIKENRFRRSYTYDKYRKNEDHYRLINAINPFWSISNPSNHEDLTDKIICNYTNRKFIDSLTFSRPHIDYARRIIHSNAKVYKYNLNDDDNFMKIVDLYKEVSDDIKNVELNPQVLLNYINLYLFTDKKIATALHLFYTKKEFLVHSRDRVSFKVCTPRSIYPSDYGQHSISTIIRDLLVEHTSRDISDIDPKSLTFIQLCEDMFSKIKNVKTYEFPEDIDDDFIDYCNTKFKTTKYTDCLIPAQKIDNEYDYIIYKNKVFFQSLVVKYHKDIKIRLIDPSHKINYTTPRSILLTIDAFMKRDVVTSKLHISTKSNNTYEQYILDRFGLYARDNMIVQYKVDYRVRIESERLLFHRTVETNLHDDVNFIKFLKTKTTPSTFDELRNNVELSNKSLNEILASYSQKNYGLNDALFLHSCGMLTNKELTNKLCETHHTMNYWPHPTEAGQKMSKAMYMKRGIVMAVTCFDVSKRDNLNQIIKEEYTFDVVVHRPFKITKIRTDILTDLLHKFRTDFKSKLAYARCISNKSSDDRHRCIYMDGSLLTLRNQRENFPTLTVYREHSYDQANVEILQENSDDYDPFMEEEPEKQIFYIFKFSNRSYKGNNVNEFHIREWHRFNFDTIAARLTDLRNYVNYYDRIINETGILSKVKDLFGHEYKYLSHRTIYNHMKKYEDKSGLNNTFSKDILDNAYKIGPLYNTLNNMELDDAGECLKSLLSVFHYESYLTDYNYLDKECDYDTVMKQILTLPMEISDPIIVNNRVINSIPILINKNYRVLEQAPYPDLINLITYNGTGTAYSRLLAIIHYIVKYYIQSQNSTFTGFG